MDATFKSTYKTVFLSKDHQVRGFKYCYCSTCNYLKPFVLQKKRWWYYLGVIKCWFGFHDFSGQGEKNTNITLTITANQLFGYGIAVCDRCHNILGVKRCMPV